MKYKFFFLLHLLFFNLFSLERSHHDLATHISKKSDLIGFIEIERERMIDQTTYLKVKFALEYFEKKNVSFVILRLNTPGGEVVAASNISKLLKEIDLNDNIPVVAFIDDWALSAGAMLAYSCRFIVATPSSSMGAAEPLHVASSGMEGVSEKINSALRSEFANLAAYYGRNPDLAEAMVDKDIVLVQRGGQIKRLRADEEIEKSDIIITTKGKLLTLNYKDLLKYEVADFAVLQKSYPPITEKEIKEGSWSAGKSAALSNPFFDDFSDSKIISYHNWKINFFSFLTNPIVVSLLFFAMIVGGYIEFSTPGFGVFGSIAIVALALILLGSFASYAINWLELIILATGVVLLLLEIFVIPGFGIAGILGIIFTIGGLIVLTLPNFSSMILSFDGNRFTLDFVGLLDRIVWIVISILFSLILVGILARFLIPKFLKRSSLIHKGDQEGYIAGISNEELPKVGEEAIAFTDLRPGGKIVVNHKIMDGFSEFGFIKRGEKVIIKSLEGDKIVVRRKV